MGKKNKAVKKDEKPFARETIIRKRRFPVASTLVLAGIVCVQIFLILFAVFGVSLSPKDIINSYEITVEPQPDGTLAMRYDITWTAVHPTEKLIWADIGMPNEFYTVDEDSLSDNILTCKPVSNEGFVVLRLFFKEAYYFGKKVDFSFSVHQKNMLCKDENGFFYEFVPGWFNSIPVEQYCVRWLATEGIDTARYVIDDSGYILWKGSLDCGEFVKVRVNYNDIAFDESAHISSYIPFDSSGVYNELGSEENALRLCLFIFAAIFVVFEVHIADSYVSYVRGRGFLRSNGQYVHIYGGINPITRNSSYAGNSTRYGRYHRRGGFGSGGGSGCACACACACAGGGRAGCSQKDTHKFPENFLGKSSKNVLQTD